MTSNHPPVWCNGALVPPDDAVVSVFDHGLTVGDGVFETLKVVDGTPFALARHLARLRRSAGGLGLDIGYEDAALRAAVQTVLSETTEMLARLRITVTGGLAPLGSGRGTATATVIVAVAPLDPAPESTAVVTVPWRRNEHGATAGLKTTSYAENVIALAKASQLGASEALLANTAGALCEGTGSNVFVVLDGQICTPPLRSGCLAGITRELVIEVLEHVIETDLPFACLDDASEIFLTSSTRDVQAVARVDDHDLGDVPGPATERARAAFAELTARHSDP